jgi:YD repeat-containing protein
LFQEDDLLIIRKEQFDIFTEPHRQGIRAQLASQLAEVNENAQVDESSGNVFLKSSKGDITTLEITDQGISGVKTAEGRHFQLSRDEKGRLTRITDPINQFLEVEYQNSGSLREIRRNGRSLIHCDYPDDDNIVKATYPDGASEVLEYSKDKLIRTVDALGNENRFL